MEYDPQRALRLLAELTKKAEELSRMATEAVKMSEEIKKAVEPLNEEVAKDVN